jgi:hypothetical protein
MDPGTRKRVPRCSRSGSTWAGLASTCRRSKRNGGRSNRPGGCPSCQWAIIRCLGRHRPESCSRRHRHGQKTVPKGGQRCWRLIRPRSPISMSGSEISRSLWDDGCRSSAGSPCRRHERSFLPGVCGHSVALDLQLLFGGQARLLYLDSVEDLVVHPPSPGEFCE